MTEPDLPKLKKDLSEVTGPELQTELAIMRTSLALDRTLLAWIRTSLTFIGFGFTLAKFIGELSKAGQLDALPLQGLDSPRNLGLTMMTLGLIGLVGGAVDHWRAEKRLNSKALTVSPWSVSFLIAVLLAALTVVLMTIIALETTHLHHRHPGYTSETEIETKTEMKTGTGIIRDTETELRTGKSEQITAPANVNSK